MLVNKASLIQLQKRPIVTLALILGLSHILISSGHHRLQILTAEIATLLYFMHCDIKSVYTIITEGRDEQEEAKTFGNRVLFGSSPPLSIDSCPQVFKAFIHKQHHIYVNQCKPILETVPMGGVRSLHAERHLSQQALRMTSLSLGPIRDNVPIRNDVPNKITGCKEGSGRRWGRGRWR